MHGERRECMSKYLADDPWLEYLETPDGKKNAMRAGDKQKKVLNKRIAKFRRSRKTKPFRRYW